MHERHEAIEATARQLEPVLHDMAVAIDRGTTPTDRLAIAQILIGFIDGYEPNAIEFYVEKMASESTIGAVLRTVMADVSTGARKTQP